MRLSVHRAEVTARSPKHAAPCRRGNHRNHLVASEETVDNCPLPVLQYTYQRTTYVTYVSRKVREPACPL